MCVCAYWIACNQNFANELAYYQAFIVNELHSDLKKKPKKEYPQRYEKEAEQEMCSLVAYLFE